MLNLKQSLAEDIKEGITAAIHAGQIKIDQVPAIVVDVPDKEGFGDYASPVALALARQTGQAPLDILAVIAEHMPKKPYVGRIKAISPGFLNIWLNPGWLMSRLDNVIEEDICCEIGVGQGKSVNLEFISANPTGPMTLGNIRTAFSADTLGNVLTCAGFNVIREYYINDYGGQIRTLGESVARRILELQGIKIDYAETLYQGDYIKDLAAALREQWQENENHKFTADDLNDKDLLDKIGAQAADILLSNIKRVVKEDLNINFDVWTSERALRASGAVDAVIKELTAKGYVYDKDGAKFLKTAEFGDSQDQVVVKKDGEYTYFVPDIAYHQGKYERRFDQIFTFVGADHAAHVPRMRAAMKMLGLDTDKLHFISAQWLGIKRSGQTVKLSKRAGKLYSPAELIAEVGRDAARFFMIQYDLSTHMDFDLDLAKERSERNPVYYVQYAYVRLRSILRQAKERDIIDKLGTTFDLSDSPALTHTMEINLMRQLYRFPEVIAQIAQQYTVHDLAYYALDVAKAVHVFYRHVPVLNSGDERIMTSRLQLVLATQTVLGKILDLLGIAKPEVM